MNKRIFMDGVEYELVPVKVDDKSTTFGELRVGDEFRYGRPDGALLMKTTMDDTKTNCVYLDVLRGTTGLCYNKDKVYKV